MQSAGPLALDFFLEKLRGLGPTASYPAKSVHRFRELLGSHSTPTTGCLTLQMKGLALAFVQGPVT